MQHYVKDKNIDSQGTRPANAPGKKTSNDDLKMNVSTTATAAANTGQVRTTTRSGTKPVRLRATQQAVAQDFHGRAPFYGTDASNADTSSTTSSCRHSKAHVNGATQNGYSKIDDRAVDPEAFGGDSGSEYGSDNVAAETMDVRDHEQLEGFDGPMPDSARQLLARHEGHSITRNHVKGSTYPSTTSGNPSDEQVNDLRGVEKHRTPAQVSSRSREAAAMGSRPAPTNVHDERAQRQVKAEADQSRGGVQGHLLADPRKDDRPVGQQVNATFSFSKAKPTAATTGHQKARAQASPEALESHRQISNNTAVRATVPTTHGTSNVTYRPVPVTKQVFEGHEQPSKHQHGASKPQKMQQVRDSIEQVSTDQDLGSDHASDLDVDVPGNIATNKRAQHEEGQQNGFQEIDLDYDRGDLLRMDYDDVKAKTFDVDPRAEEFKFADDEPATDIESKVRTVAEFSLEDQSKFFGSLSLDEWEQAGDWFITRFSEVLNKLKVNRKDTREAAKTFESDIEKRHGAVRKKRKQINDELTEMKESGGKVLQGTPKKAKTKR